MRMDFFAELEKLILCESPQEKCHDFKVFYALYTEGKLHFDHDHVARTFETPSYHQHCQLVSPAVVLKRKKLSTDQGKAIFLHAIAHIEYSAIDLALDAAYRFKNMPLQFYADWLSVAHDEVRHFEMLAALLHEVDSFYGAFPVHDALFEASSRTTILHERMAVVPRYLEANGLDATPIMIQKLQGLENDIKAQKIIEVLEVILEEECDHVLKGDVWFKYACDLQELPYDIYFEIIERYYPGSFPRKKALNVTARQDSGFSCSELKRMNHDIEC
jgi:uncharacterized ferritin-like protein (DUF455 family)